MDSSWTPIRLRNLVKLSINIKGIETIFAPAKENQSLLVKAMRAEFSKILVGFIFPKVTSDVPISYHVSGYVSKKLGRWGMGVFT